MALPVRDRIHRTLECPHVNERLYRLRLLATQRRVTGNGQPVRNEIARLEQEPNLSDLDGLMLRLYGGENELADKPGLLGPVVGLYDSLLPKVAALTGSGRTYASEMLSSQVRLLVHHNCRDEALARLDAFLEQLKQLFGHAENMPGDLALWWAARSHLAYRFEGAQEATVCLREALDLEPPHNASPCYSEVLVTRQALMLAAGDDREGAHEMMEDANLPLCPEDEFWDESRPKLLDAALKWFGYSRSN